jgi:outer membrane protein OmpA-like peptidoglycan-associated protein
MRFGPGFLVGSMVSSFLVGCGAPDRVEPIAGSVCVDIPNGQYFQFVEGRLVATSSAEISAQERPYETLRRLQATLDGMGYPWVTLSWDGRVAIVSGMALDENSRSDAFIAAKSAFEADPVAGPLVERVINDMDTYAAEDAIAIRLTDELVQEDGLKWLRVVIAGRVATLEGVATNAEDKEVGYRTGRATVESDLAASQLINIVVDAIQVRDDDEPVGKALIDLKSDATVDECQAAFDAIMTGREVAFEVNETIVKKSSSRLLDAITGVALLCDTHEIEIGGHIAADTVAADALELTQRRASSIRDYLMAYGVSPDALSARGYGRDAPVDEPASDDTNPSVTNTRFIVRAGET